MIDANNTRVEKFLNKCKNNLFVAILVIGTIVIIGIGSLTDSLNKVIDFSSKYLLKSRDISTSEQKTTATLSTTQSNNQQATAPSTPPPTINQSKEPFHARKTSNLITSMLKRSSSDPQNSPTEGKGNEVDAKVSNIATSSEPSPIAKVASDPPSDKSLNAIAENKPSLKTDDLVQKDSIDSATPTPSAHCPDLESLAHGFDAARRITSASERDAIYLRIINNALCSFSYEFALTAALGMNYFSSKDNAYITIVDAAIKQRNFKLANEVSDKISSASTRDSAKRRIVEATTGQ